MKKINPKPIEVIKYLAQAHKFHKEENIPKEDWMYAEKIYKILLKAFRMYQLNEGEKKKNLSILKKLSTKSSGLCSQGVCIERFSCPHNIS